MGKYPPATLLHNKNLKWSDIENKIAIPAADMESNISHELAGTKKIKRLDTPCRLHFHSRRHGETDPDGISAKAAIDGLVLCGLLPDDTAKEIKSITYSQERIEKTEVEETIITIDFL